MIQYDLLAYLAENYDFTSANKIVKMEQTKPFIRSWLTLELCLAIKDWAKTEQLCFATPYQNIDYFKYVSKSGSVELCEKRYASKADLKVVSPGTTGSSKACWFEFHVLHQDELNSKRDLNKLYEDAKRVAALRKSLVGDEVTLIIGLWGSFNAQDIKRLAPLDTSTQASYVYDTSLSGSTSIARLCQMKREGTERFLLAAY